MPKATNKHATNEENKEGGMPKAVNKHATNRKNKEGGMPKAVNKHATNRKNKNGSMRKSKTRNQKIRLTSPSTITTRKLELEMSENSHPHITITSYGQIRY